MLFPFLWLSNQDCIDYLQTDDNPNLQLNTLLRKEMFLLYSTKMIACGNNAIVSGIKYLTLIKKLYHNTVFINCYSIFAKIVEVSK